MMNKKNLIPWENYSLAKRVYLVSYCLDADIVFLKTILCKDDILIGVDQGTEVLLKNNLYPDIIVGDFDSFSLNKNILPEKCLILELNPDKDESDLEYAVNLFYEKINIEIIIINNLQGRIDHILSVVYLLEKIENGCIQNAEQEVFLINKNFERELPINSTISLIPISEEVKSIFTEGMLYRLANETLYRNETRGLSNKSVDKKIKIKFIVGKMLVVINKRIL
ncbi:MAG: thiamine diphosphokinase [Candidatus Cloacimonetes bacterium]|nr:thiamine diphosphokinase [Candidatus Cloacimonadota bacterium]